MPGWFIRHIHYINHPYLGLLSNLVTYRPNPLPFEILPTDQYYPAVADRIEELLGQFTDIPTDVKLSRRKDGMSIVTPRGKYRIIVAKNPRWRHEPVRGYYTYVITQDYLAPENQRAMETVFRILFMGDEYLLPFLQPGPKQLTLPQQKVYDAFQQSYEASDPGGAVILPTGVGKTVLAAKIINYALGPPKQGRLLFLAHRTLILDQAISTIRAENSFYQKKDIGRVFGATRDKAAELRKKAVFGTPNSVYKLLPQIPPNYYDFVLIDEFHHGPSKRYRTILDHLTPRYTLGLTATPYREDASDPLAMVRNNVLYTEEAWETQQRIEDGEGFLPTFRLSSALALGYLVTPTIYVERESPYYDDEGAIIPVNKLHEYAIPARAKKIAEKFHEHIGDKQTVIFCGSVNEAGFLAEQFNQLGIPSRYLLSRYPGTTKPVPLGERKKILKGYRNRKIKVLFTVDIFNEGADVPTIEAAVWLQQSVTIVKILQQLGRGLRLAPGKRELIVLDFVNNIKQVKEFLRYGRTSTGQLAEIQPTPPKNKIENKDLIDLLIDDDAIKIDEELLYLLEREAWEDTDDYAPFFEILCDYGYTNREIIDIVNETNQHIAEIDPTHTYHPIGTQRLQNWLSGKQFLTRPASPTFRAFFFRDLLTRMGVEDGVISTETQNIQDQLRQQQARKVFSKYFPFGEHYPDVLIEKHREIVAAWNTWGRYRHVFAKYLESLAASDPALNLKKVTRATLDNTSKLQKFLQRPTIARILESEPLEHILSAAEQFLKQLPKFQAMKLYAKKRMELIEISQQLKIPYEDVKRWHDHTWENAREDYLPVLVKKIMGNRYGLKQSRLGPEPRSATYTAMIDDLARTFDEDKRDIEEVVIAIRANQLERMRPKEITRPTAEPKEERVQRSPFVQTCKSCGQLFTGRTKKCVSCKAPLCPACAQDFCGVCYTSQT